MNPIRRLIVTRRLAASLKPQPGLLAHRMAQMGPERRERAMRNHTAVAEELGL